ncbi:uncharacterized protein LOC106636679 [Copidosoma floridanum]|uniref:uncharacterized protein LOC106636679 n=1 Tax=Copidosoma floridanum TaxID=29053 RepID=UPI0006C9D944|nr:uncharacterized protein LOC106636679 [Copidosoma floridanum]
MGQEKQQTRTPRVSIGAWIVVGTALVLGSIVQSCDCAPTVGSKNAWHDYNDVPAALLGAACDPETGRCWDSLPSVARDNYLVEPNKLSHRTQPIHVRAAQEATDTQLPANPADYVSSMRGRSRTRHSKKDTFMSRGWGAGGMPFSVLSMKPRANNHSSSSTPTQGETSKNGESVSKNGAGDSPALAPPTTGRSGLSNSSNSGQPRRHYSIIPQLFISYGWGPSGK